MAFSKQATVEGCPVSYAVSPSARKFTFKDVGFTETASGNFQYNRPLEGLVTDKQGFRLKITVAEDLKTLKMSITTANGMKSMNIFKGDKFKDQQEKFYFTLDEMIERGCFEKIE